MTAPDPRSLVKNHAAGWSHRATDGIEGPAPPPPGALQTEREDAYLIRVQNRLSVTQGMANYG